ncbi:MAG: helix-turn-helix domain-containing protein, partial [Bacteroidota bacterium]
EYVLSFWVLECDHLEKPYIHRTMADCCPELLFHYRGRFDELISDTRTEQSFTSGIHAASQKFRRFIINEGFGMFGVALYPFAVPLLSGVSPVEIVNTLPDIHSLLGRTGRELEEKMMHAVNNTERARIISAFLEGRLLKTKLNNRRIVAAIKHITHLPEPQRIRSVAEHFNVSRRQFERKFKEHSGFNPKLYSRIVRFQRTVSKYRNGSHRTLTELAYECGYYDQSHFIHDFKEFSGYHPKQFFSGKATEATAFLDD